MKRLVSAILVFGVVAVVLLVPTAALAHHRGHFSHGFVPGVVTGVIVGHVIAPPVVVVPVIPVFGPVHYPAATCWDFWVNGYWAFGTSWVPGHWERVCR